MRSQVQVLAGPPTITPGHSAAGGKPGTLAVSLGRAGAARPSPPAPHRPLRARPPGRPGATATTHRGHPPIPRTQPRGRCGHLALRPPPGPRAAAGDGRSARRPGLPGRPASSGPPPAPDPAPGPPPTMRNLGVACVRAGSAVDRAAQRRGSPQGPRPVPVVRVPRRLGLSPLPPPHRNQPDASGRTGRTPAGRTPDRPDTSRPDAGSRTTNPVTDTGQAGHRTAGHRTAGPRTTEPDGWTPHAGRGPAADAMVGVLALSSTATVPDRWMPAGQTPCGRSTNQDSAAARTTRGITLPGTGLDHRHDRQLLGRFPGGRAAPRRTAVLGTIRMERRAGGARSSVMASADVGG